MNDTPKKRPRDQAKTATVRLEGDTAARMEAVRAHMHSVMPTTRFSAQQVLDHALFLAAEAIKEKAPEGSK